MADSILDRINSYDPDKPYIYICYSAADCHIVYEDVFYLQQMGYNVWLDEKSLDKQKPSWRDDAMAAIESFDCVYMLFYVSRHSMISQNCYHEILATLSERTQARHRRVPLPFLALDVENVGNIVDFVDHVVDPFIRSSSLSKAEKNQSFDTLQKLFECVFNNNNERVRIHPKHELNRKSDYYSDIIRWLPAESRNQKPGIADSGMKQNTYHQPTENKPAGLTVQNKSLGQVEKKIQKSNVCPSSVFNLLNSAPKSPDTSAEDFFQKAKKSYDAGDYKASFGLFKEAVRHGHTNAMYYLGYQYEKGCGVASDLPSAAECYRTGANRNDTDSMYRMGILLEFGRGVQKDTKTAEAFYARAAAGWQTSALKGDLHAQEMLAYLYEYGKGVQEDHVRAEEWRAKAFVQKKNLAEQGNLWAQYEVARTYESGKPYAPKNMTEAIKWCMKAAEQGDAYNQSRLGYLYKQGQGILKDQAMSDSWYKKAFVTFLEKTREGDLDACFQVARCYKKGEGIEANANRAREWFDKAMAIGEKEAALGNVRAMEIVAHNYLYSFEIIPTDLSKAVEWYQKAAALNSTRAMGRLGSMYEFGAYGSEKNLEKAVYWYEKEAEQGQFYAQRRARKLRKVIETAS
ncbi:MAG: toll/interleukin-1 receptor domain-containing protein [Lachnospiraceae bacterium]|nr:toll/interleukin-1 receptor domain-containing protein [Lachnospiraceae bacterium]